MGDASRKGREPWANHALLVGSQSRTCSKAPNSCRKEGSMRYWLLVLLSVATLMACAAPAPTPTATPTPRPPTPTPTPIYWYTPAEITSVYRTNPARANVLFERSFIYIKANVAEFHPNELGLIYLVKRRAPATDFSFLYSTGEERASDDWKVIRAQLSVGQVARMNIGDEIYLRCTRLEKDEYVGTGSELICQNARLITP